ncbi:MAG: hypothetical protein VKN72_16325 [Nostocales cyanobacterium 94392]|nr:hypothetical protein [Nostocales cyanobacterium 94392]
MSQNSAGAVLSLSSDCVKNCCSVQAPYKKNMPVAAIPIELQITRQSDILSLSLLTSKSALYKYNGSNRV